MLALVAAWLTLAADGAREAERLVGILEYVAGDYGGAVRAGRVVDEAEYREQQVFMADARALVRELGAPEAAVDHLASLINNRATADEVRRAARAARDDIMTRLHVAVLPSAVASKTRAAERYQQLCVSCHGPKGEGNGPQAAELKPPPRSFHNAEFLETASPHRAYHALTYGVQGTAMAAFSALPPEERLALAFYVFTFKHRGNKEQAIPLSLREAALRSNGELLERLGTQGLAYARVSLPWLAQDPIVEARRLARAALGAITSAPPESRRLVAEAYLEGFEAAEVRLRARDGQLVHDIEAAFLSFRTALDRMDEPRATTELVRLERLLDRADATLARQAPRGWLAFWGSLLIFLREGIEIALIIAALLAVLRRAGRPELAQTIHAGWVAALGCGLLTWWLASAAISRIGANREAVEGAVSLFAAAVLFYVSFWLLSRADSRRWMAYLREQVDRSLSRKGRSTLFAIAFLATYREAFETVLFYQALLGEIASDHVAIVGGILVGLLGVVGVAFGLMRAGARLPLGVFFGASGGLLCLLSVAFAGAGLHELRAAKMIGSYPMRAPEIDWLGVHADRLGLAVQGIMVATIALIGVRLLRARAHDDKIAEWSASGSAPNSSQVSPS